MKEKILELKIQRTDKLQIYIKTSPELAKFFAKGVSYTYSENCLTTCIPRVISDFYFANTNSSGYRLVDSGRANVTILGTVGIENGLNLEFKGIYSNASIELFVLKLKEHVRTIYNEYIKQVNVSCVLEVLS